MIRQILNYREAESGASGALLNLTMQSQKWLPDAVTLLGWNPWAMIVHPKTHPIRVVAQANCYRLSHRTVFRGVVEDVDEDLFYRVRVSERRRRLDVELDAH